MTRTPMLVAAGLGLLLLASCNMENEFAQLPAAMMAQVTRDLSDIAGFPVPSYMDGDAVRLKAFRVGAEVYLAIAVRLPEFSGILVVDKNLGLIWKIDKDVVPGFDWGARYWNIDGTPSASTYGFHVVALSTFNPDSTPSPTGRSVLLNWDTRSIVMDNTITPPYLLYRGRDWFIGRMGNPPEYLNMFAPPYVTQVNSIALPDLTMVPADYFYYDNGGRILSGYMSASGLTAFLTDFSAGGKQAVAWLESAGLPGMNLSNPVFFLSVDPAALASSSTSTTNHQAYRIMDLKFDPEKDGGTVPTREFILDIRAVNTGFIVPYPSGRDRLIDFTTGDCLYTFQVRGSDSKEGDNKSNVPRAYVNGADFWFLFDRKTGQILRVKGWWE